jgi:hypothetical protein
MSPAHTPRIQGAALPWLTDHGIDLALYPIDGVLRQALSSKDEDFRSACSILKAMCSAGRVDAGVFLLGLQKHYSENYERLTFIADALEWFQSPATVQAFASELRRVQGSSTTRRYLRRIIDALKQLPPELTGDTIQSLCSDPLVGTRFRQHLKELTSGNGW